MAAASTAIGRNERRGTRRPVLPGLTFFASETKDKRGGLSAVDQLALHLLKAQSPLPSLQYLVRCLGLELCRSIVGARYALFNVSPTAEISALDTGFISSTAIRLFDGSVAEARRMSLAIASMEASS